MANQMRGGSGGQIAVFNPLPCSRDGRTEVPVSLPGGAGTEHQRNEGQREHTHCRVVCRPSLRWKHSHSSRLAFFTSLASVECHVLRPGTGTQNGGRIGRPDNHRHAASRSKTPLVEVTFDPNGGIRSMTDAQNGVALLKRAKRFGLFAGRIDGQDSQSCGTWSLTCARDGLPRATARQVGFIDSIPYELEMKFSADTPRIDCRSRFNFNGQQIGLLSDNKGRDHTSGFVHEHKLRFKMFPNVTEQAVAARDLPFAVAETSDRYVNGTYWTAMADGTSDWHCSTEVPWGAGAGARWRLLIAAGLCHVLRLGNTHAER